VFKWANFIILFGGLGWYLRKPLLAFLDSRSGEIQEGLKQAREAKAKAAAQLAEVEARMSRLDAEVRALREEALQQAEEERLRILENAHAESRKILEMAQLEIEGLRKSARMELKRHVAELAVKLAEERLQTAIGPEENRRIVERFLQGLENTRN
jgi:F-type H+-transporting ATPase subunit b